MTDTNLPIVDYCRVCGLPSAMRWEDLQHEICPSCGCHIGLHDIDLESTREKRDEWKNENYKWRAEYRGPSPNWYPIEQMKNIPPEWL